MQAPFIQSMITFKLTSSATDAILALRLPGNVVGASKKLLGLLKSKSGEVWMGR